ncbi:hypothetical protein CYLTODRAFT_415146 [Cylindrobasidium torrendii FP15055 ss-10]|uniref:F-box domain-containing protein n=1 Tax=Cylindrobasidium torrendii FP15055 ss-10 TaxID=1314674 RepID=A0A0D7AUI1_9AGAR|nr:hypothetical protein CYLTODRAFT_415146 [Cylindrobasidium torrendii FP15055 ss-10]
MKSLNFDIIGEILRTQLQDARNASLVCRNWRSIAGPVLFRRLFIKSDDTVETARTFRKHPELLVLTRDVSFVDIRGVDADDICRAVVILEEVLPLDKLEGLTLLRCREHNLTLIDPAFILSFTRISFIQSMVPTRILLAMTSKRWKQLHFHKVQWEGRIRDSQFQADSLWVEPFAQFNNKNSNAQLTVFVTRLLSGVECLTLVDIDTDLAFSPQQQHPASFIQPSIRHLSVVTTSCDRFLHRQERPLASLCLVAGSEDLSALCDIVQLGVPNSLASVHFELHPKGRDLDRVQSLWKATISHKGLKSVVSNVCLCRLALPFGPEDSEDEDGEDEDEDQEDRQFARLEVEEQISQREEVWRQQGASFNFIRPDCTIQGPAWPTTRKWIHGQDSCMVCSGSYPFERWRSDLVEGGYMPLDAM